MDLTDGAAFLPAVHFHVGRDGRAVDMIILHWMDTNLAGTDATFTGGGRVASATYGIEDTTVHQYVKEADASFNAADWDANMRSIAIEHSAAPGRDASAATIETSVQVCLAMMRKYPAIGNRVYPHSKFYATACPGTLPWQYIRDEALRRLAGAAAPVPTRPTGFLMALTDAEQSELLAHVRELVNIARTGRRDGDVKVWPFPFTPADATLGQAQRNDQHADARAVTLTATIAKLAGSNDLTLDQIKAALAEVVAESVTVTGSLDIGPAASTP